MDSRVQQIQPCWWRMIVYRKDLLSDVVYDGSGVSEHDVHVGQIDLRVLVHLKNCNVSYINNVYIDKTKHTYVW